MDHRRRESRSCRVALLPIGRELLTGRILDSNSQFLASRLFEMGILVQRTCSVDDDIEAIGREIRRCKADRVAVIITCGGLGPTPDDMTMKAVAAALGRVYLPDPVALKQIERRYGELFEAGRLLVPGLTPDREKMAWMPEGTSLLPNDVGTAPGADITWGSTRLFCLPGVPAEMKAMAEESVFPQLDGLSGETVRRVTLEFGVMDESSLAAVIRRLMPVHPRVHMKPNPKGFGKQRVMLVHLESEGSSAARAQERLDACSRDLVGAVREL